MKRLVVHGALVRCSQGAAPAALSVLPLRAAADEGRAVATIHDQTPANLSTFGMCRSPANPSVASATAAAQGVLTPMPCVPALPAPWSNGAGATTIEGVAALTADATCSCSWAGTLTVESSGSDVSAD